MTIASRVRHSIPLVKPLPFETLRVRWLEKLHVVSHMFGLSGAKVVGSIDESVILKFRANCDVASKGQLIQLPQDEGIFQHVKVFGEWGGVEAAFLAAEINRLLRMGFAAAEILFVDMGANVGLVTTQTMNKVPLDVRCIAIEPVPLLVRALDFNRCSMVPDSKIKILPVAIGEQTGIAKFEIDPHNYGSSSLSLVQNRTRNKYTIDVEVLSSEDFANNEIARNQLVVLKSDLEGFDCGVLASLPDWVWENIYAGVVEVTSDSGSDLSKLPLLLAKLDGYRLLSWDAKMTETVSTSEIQEFWGSNLREIRNLYFTK